MDPMEYARRRQDADLAKRTGLTDAVLEAAKLASECLTEGYDLAPGRGLQWYFDQTRPERSGGPGTPPRTVPAWVEALLTQALQLDYVEKVGTALLSVADTAWTYSMSRDEVKAVNQDPDALRALMDEQGLTRHPSIIRRVEPVSVEDMAEGARRMRANQDEG